MASQTSFANFRKQPVAPAAARPTAGGSLDLLPGPGRLPMKPGTTLRLTPAEQAGLTAVGWQPGDPVPHDLATIAAEHVASARNVQGMLPVDPSTPPVVLDNILNLKDLPQAQQQAFIQTAQSMIARDRALQAAQAQLGDDPLPPGVGDALALSAKMDAQRQQQRPAQAPPTPAAPRTLSSVIGNRRPPRPPSPPAATPPEPQPIPLGNPAGDWAQGPPRGDDLTQASFGADPFENLRVLARERAQQAEAPPQDEEPQMPANDHGSGLYMAECPHCKWQLDRPDEIEPGPADKYGFLAMVLGGAGVRFRKEVVLMGGAVVVTFRSLTAAESDLTWKQLGFDRRADRVDSGFDQLARIQSYRLAMALESVETHTGGLTSIPEAGTVAPAGKETVLAELSDWIVAEVLPSEHLRREVMAAFARFQLLCEKMEANMHNADFWEGIGAQP